MSINVAEWVVLKSRNVFLPRPILFAVCGKLFTLAPNSGLLDLLPPAPSS